MTTRSDPSTPAEVLSVLVDHLDSVARAAGVPIYAKIRQAPRRGGADPAVTATGPAIPLNALTADQRASIVGIEVHVDTGL